ncbi:MAG: FAD-dependent oxidoreductase [Pseudomonadota bacterium]|nr:FAD-dependent oxidoreductase [Pseudomonadota bacterium]
MSKSIVIIGAGLAGVTAARCLRTEGYQGTIHLIGEEPCIAYDRPCLSKELLAGKVNEPAAILGPDWSKSANITLHLAERVTGIDIANRQVRLQSDGHIPYDYVLLATGSRARRIQAEGSNLPGIHTLRTYEDANRLKDSLATAKSLVIIGGGLIGCEVATTASGLGASVTILESGDELLLRVLGRDTGKWCRNELERIGVQVERSAHALRFEGDERVRAVVCTDGRRIEAETVLVSIGAEPADDLARAAGIECQPGGGVLVDATGKSSDPRVFAAGDVAAWPLRSGERRSLETYLNSQIEAETAALAMLGKPQPSPQTQTSWTEISGHRLQMAGDINGPGEIVVRNNEQSRSRLLFRVLDNRMEAAIAIDDPRDFSIASRLVTRGVPVSTPELADPQFSLRDFLKAKA